MRRIIHNTTAIAACLSLLAPHALMAQTAAPEDGAQVEVQADTAVEAEAAAENVAEAVTEAVEAATTEATTAEACADGSAPPCEVAAEADAAVEAEAEVEAEAAAAAAAAPEAAAEEMPAAEAEAAAAEPAVEDAVAAEAAAEAEVAPEAEAEVEAEAVTPEAEAAATAVEEATAEETVEPAPAEPVTPEPAVAATTETEAAPAAEAAAAVEAAAPAVADAPATDTATEADELEKALAAEAAKATTPAKENVTAEEAATAKADAETEAKAETPVAPVVSEAAKEAAAAATVSSAAALNDDAGKGEVTEETVTEDNTRSSSEDFTTALKDALATQADPQKAEASKKDDDKSDLTKAVLLGLGGLAVGAMLANNRQVALSSPDRVVVTRADGSQQIIKDEVALLRQPGSTVATENFDDGSSRTIVTRADGSRVVTIRDADLRVLRRTLISADGNETRLIDDTSAEPVDLATLPSPAEASAIAASEMSEADLRAALLAEPSAGRRFSLAQIRDIPQVRSLVAPVNIDAITFDTGSAAIKPDQAKKLSALGNVIRESIVANPGEVFLIEAHTDTVGSDAANLALSDRRAESVALALTEYFDVAPENMVVQGYGEQQLKVAREGDVRENRRASVRRITGLLQQGSN